MDIVAHIQPLALIISVCGSSAIAGAILKHGADSENWVLFALSLVLYSCASFGMLLLYRSGAATNFATTTFIALLGTLLATQILSVAMGEPFNAKAFAVLIIASAAFAWACQEPTTNQSSNISTATNGELL